MGVVSVKIPNHIQKKIGTQTITFLELYNKMEKENWVDEKLDKPMEMGKFYNLLKKEL